MADILRPSILTTPKALFHPSGNSGVIDYIITTKINTRTLRGAHLMLGITTTAAFVAKAGNPNPTVAMKLLSSAIYGTASLPLW